ncbi:MAG: hypothetical protein AAF487_15335, partial [Bacteroidota bacterium]
SHYVSATVTRSGFFFYSNPIFIFGSVDKMLDEVETRMLLILLWHSITNAYHDCRWTMYGW